jgi:hypothetical protein
MADTSIDVAAAQAALDAAGGMPDQFVAPTPDPWAAAPATNTPDPEPTPDAPPAPAADDAPPAPDADTEPDFGSFTQIDASTLTPEQQQMQRSLQADYTRKMQEAAPWRKLAEESGISSPDEFKQAAEVFQRLQDPRNWPTIHGELTEYMQQYGMTPAQAQAAASDQLMNLAPDTPPEPDYSGYNPDEADPSTGPLMRQIQQLSNQVAQMQAQTTQEQQSRQQQAQWNAAAQALTSQENHIKAQNPHYGDDEITAIYNLMGTDGNLVAAQQRFESMIGAQVSKYIAGKTGAAQGTPAPVGGGGVISTPSQPVMTREEGHRAAMAHVAALDRAE